MHRFSACFLTILILIAVTPSINLLHGFNTRELIYTARIYLLAVKDEGNGVVVNSTMKIYYPGRGDVIIPSGKVIIDNDTITSIKYALKLASIITGVNYQSYDYEFEFPPGTRLKGASGTLEFLLIFTQFFTNTSISKRFSATGVVSINGIIGLVKNINEKYRAAVENGIELVIGPYVEVNDTKYIPVVDCFTAFRVLNIDIPLNGDFENLENSININYFKKPVYEAMDFSYNYFKNMIEDLISNFTKYGIINDISDLYNITGFKYYRLSQKFYEEGRVYTAASLAFRSFIELETLFLKRLLNISQSEAMGIIEWINKTTGVKLEYLKNRINNLTMYSRTLWDIDILTNAYIRYDFARISYSMISNRDVFEAIEYLVFSFARAVTAEHWLEMLSRLSGTGRWFTREDYSTANNVLMDFLSEAIKYYEALGVKNISEMIDLDFNNYSEVFKYIKLINVYNTLAMLSRRLEPPIFTLYNTSSGINELNTTINYISGYIMSSTGVALSSILTLQELTYDYLRINMSLSIIGDLYADKLALIIPYLALIHAYKLASKPTYTILNTFENTSKVFDYQLFISATLLVVTAFLTGYLIGSSRRKITY